MHEVISGRLYTVKDGLYIPDNGSGKTAILNLSEDPELIPISPVKSGRIYINWSMEDDVDEMSFFGIVRMCALIMRGHEQSVLLVGHQDTIDVMASCIVREYLGCNADIAIGVVRENRKSCLNKSELIETVFNYQVS